jgi:protease-4
MKKIKKFIANFYNRFKSSTKNIKNRFKSFKLSKAIDPIKNKIYSRKKSKIEKFLLFPALLTLRVVKKILSPLFWVVRKPLKFFKNTIVSFYKFIKQVFNLSYYQKLPEFSSENKSIYLVTLHNSIRPIKIVCIVLLFFALITPSLCGLKNFVKKINKMPESDIIEVKIHLPIMESNYDLKKIDNIIENDKPKLVILNISSPGGSASFSYSMFRKLANLSQKTKLVVITEGFIASGAYMISMAAHKIFASEMSIVGSIGVISNYYEITELANKIGIKFENIKTSQYKASPNPYEKTNSGVRQYQQDLLGDVMDLFKKIVNHSRKIDIKDYNEVFSGKVFIANKAKELGLIDEIANRDDVIEAMVKEGIMKDRNQKIKEISIEKERDQERYAFGRVINSIINIFGIDLSNRNSSNKYEVLAM